MINVDGSFRKVDGRGGTGVVIRDSNSSFIAGSYAYVEHMIDPPTAEAMALMEGLLLAQHIGCNGFIIQSDCVEVCWHFLAPLLKIKLILLLAMTLEMIR
jgi:ribonuclease HI